MVLESLEDRTVEKSKFTIEHVLKEDEEAEKELRTLSQSAEIDTVHFSADRARAEIGDYLRSASQDKDGLYIHSRYAVARDELDEKGFDWVASTLLQENFSLEGLGSVIEAVIVTCPQF